MQKVKNPVEKLTKEKPYHVIQDGKEGLAVARFDLVAADLPLVEGGKAFGLDLETPEADEDFLYKWFRCLSAAITQSRFFDFSGQGVLNNAVPFFNDITIYANHRTDVTQWKGKTVQSVWDGENTPPGVNALFRLDRQVDPTLCRGVDTGALRSASATIFFQFKKSHPDLRYFYDHIGTEVDGEIVRFIVTAIQNVGEMSIVWEGEDKYAKAFSFAGAGDEPEKTLAEGDKSMEIQISKEFLEKLCLTEQPTEAAFLKAVDLKIEALEAEKEALKADAEAGQAHLAEVREQAVTLYKAVKGEDAKEAFIKNVLEKADLGTAKAYVEEYQAGVEDAVPLTCPKCGEKMARRSSQATDPGGGKETRTDVNINDYKVG